MKSFDELWPLPYPEIVIVTGPFGCGKSTFTLGTGAIPERYFIVDFEKSQKSFAQQLPLKYVDMQARMGESFPNGYKMIDLYRKTVEILDKELVQDLYDVLVLDNASNLEEAIVAFVEANPAEFGHSLGQYQSMSGLKWGDVKNKYQQLLTRWVSRVKMIFIVVHLRDKWSGNTVIKNAFGKPIQEPKGKETLDQLSSLFVWLEHGPNQIPAAMVLKCRIDQKVYIEDPENPPENIPSVYLDELNGEPGIVSIPVLPLRLPKCTWPAIREYMRNPADLSNPKPGELPTEAQMNDDDRLKLRAIIADREAEKANVERLKMEAVSSQQASRVANPPKKAAAPKLSTQPTQQVNQEPDQEPAEESTVEPVSTADSVKVTILETAEKWEGKKISDGKRGVLVPVIETCFAAGDATGKRHQLQKFLTGKSSLTEIPDNFLIALYTWMKPYQDSGGAWLPNPESALQANQIISFLDAANGQLNLLELQEAQQPV